MTAALHTHEGIDGLAGIIAAHLAEWEPSPAFVELAIYDCADASFIAETLNEFCLRTLGSSIARGLFHQSSIGSVTGVVLEDGRSVVIKAHQPGRSAAVLAEVVRVQSYLAGIRLFATEVIAGPLLIGRGHAIIERFVGVGSKADGHHPAIRKALAASLHAITEACRPLVKSTLLKQGLVMPMGDALWPTPHSKLFDFEITASGAEWIDDVARCARDRARSDGDSVGQQVIGHGDWRVEHVRFIGDTPVIAFDWDSLCCEREPALVGAAAHGFCADWSQTVIPQAATLNESLSFVSEYERARGIPFSAAERKLCRASLAYAIAYGARCGYAVSGDQHETPGTFLHWLWNERAQLLEF
jgi:hypothetical protein